MYFWTVPTILLCSELDPSLAGTVAALTIVAWDYTASALAANTNTVVYGNGSAQIAPNGWSATMAAAVVSQAQQDGLLSVALADWRTSLAAIGDGANGTYTTFSPVFGAASTGADHPRDYAYVVMEQAALQAQVSGGWVAATLNAGTPDPENAVDTRLLQWGDPYNPSGANTTPT